MYVLCARTATPLPFLFPSKGHMLGGGGGGEGRSEFRSCVKVEVAVLMSPIVSVDVKQH